MTQYYADIGLDRTIDRPYFVWRHVRKPYSSPQWYDRPARRWIDDPWLYCFIMNGEIGSEPITKKKALEIISRWERS